MDLELVADNLAFPEGPMVFSDGSSMVCEIAAGIITKITSDGRRSVFAECGGGPNGAAIGPDDAIYVCNNGGRFEWDRVGGLIKPTMNRGKSYAGGLIQRVDANSGAVTTLYDNCAGTRFLSPNDLVFDREGGFWFTDNGMADDGTLTCGALYYALADGSSVKRVRKHVLSPNGVGLSPDETMLYFADTLTARLYACPIESPGILQRSNFIPGRVLATMPGNAGFDSLAVEAGGHICVATLHRGGITVITTDGAIEHVAFPDDYVTNIAFGGPNMDQVWVTCSSTGRLFRSHWPRPGLRPNFNK